MYKLSLSRTAKLDLLNSVITSLKKIKSRQRLKSGPQSISLLTKFSDSSKLLTDLKNEVILTRENEIKEYIHNLKNKLKISSFSLMEHNFIENTHSNILEYIFDYSLIGDDGADILSEFIQAVNPAVKYLPQLIRKKNYYIYREYSVKNGRMDILILDTVNKFAIVIENKLLASVSEKEQLEEDEGINKTQLDLYLDHITKFHASYQKLFILLSYKKVDPPDKYHPFVSVDYNLLYQIINHFEIDDNILIEYKLLLRAITTNIYSAEKELFRQIYSLSQNSNSKIQNLNSLEKLRILLNGFN